MPFGKYRGFPIEDIPESYLKWLWSNVQLEEPLRSAIAAALKHVGKLPDVIRPEIVRDIYRRLSKKWHPDVGGSVEAMQAINDFYDALKEAQSSSGG